MKKSNKSLSEWTIPLSDAELSQGSLDIDDKTRSNLFQWNGQFSPQLIEALIKKYGEEQKTILDPFMGSGTVLVEAAKFGICAVGCDVNPAAFNIARVYTLMRLLLKQREAIFAGLESTFLRPVDCKDSLYEIYYCDSIALGDLIPLFVGEASIANSVEAQIIVDLWATLLGKELESSKPKTASKIYFQVKNVVLDLPITSSKILAHNSDCKAIPVQDSTCDLVITSPPYINVFNYHQQYRKAVEELGEKPLLAAQSEIGANRKHRGNRFLTTIQYCLDISHCLMELTRACADGSRAIFVVGRESKVRGIPFQNGLMVSQVSEALGIELVLRQERKFQNKFGEMIYEDILHLHLHKRAKLNDGDVRKIALAHLQNGLREAVGDVKDDLIRAIDKIGDVQPSPIYGCVNE